MVKGLIVIMLSTKTSDLATILEYYENQDKFFTASYYNTISSFLHYVKYGDHEDGARALIEREPILSDPVHKALAASMAAFVSQSQNIELPSWATSEKNALSMDAPFMGAGTTKETVRLALAKEHEQNQLMFQYGLIKRIRDYTVY